MIGRRGLVSALTALLAAAACSDVRPSAPTGSAGHAGEDQAQDGGANAGGGDDGRGASGAAGDAGDGGADDAGEGGADGDGYAGADTGNCTPGVPRCHGDFGYQMCEQDGAWGESHSCAGYSLNGTSSYCVDVPTGDGEPWGTCVDPACWFWMTRGFDVGAAPVGSCTADGKLQRCSTGGALSLETCAGACTQVGSLDGRALGFCAATCDDGARECLGGGLYRECEAGRWNEVARACPDGQECSPLSKGALPDIRCGGGCELGTSRCRADRLAVETCNGDGEWQVERECLLGRCTTAGPQAECQAACSDGQRACAFDGAGSERVCDESGAWSAELPCSLGASCRLDGTLPLGCVACVGAAASGGNAFGVSDARCLDGALQLCGAGHRWSPAVACSEGGTCVGLERGASSAAACAAP